MTIPDRKQSTRLPDDSKDIEDGLQVIVDYCKDMRETLTALGGQVRTLEETLVGVTVLDTITFCEQGKWPNETYSTSPSCVMSGRTPKS